jgi:hypothetical protein
MQGSVEPHGIITRVEAAGRADARRGCLCGVQLDEDEQRIH